MDYNSAKNILLLPDKFDELMVKKQYHILALKYHPDKNINVINAAEKFTEIHDAYEYMNLYQTGNSHGNNPGNNPGNGPDMNYNYLFTNFFNSLFDGNIYSEQIIKIIESLAFNYNDFVMNTQGREMLEKLDDETVLYVYNILMKYQHLIGLSNDALNYIQQMINDRIKDDFLIELNPSMNDLLNDNIYILDYEDDLYYIPLWHHKMQYEIPNIDMNIYKTKKLIVVCNPETPSNVEINPNGDITIIVRENINNVLNNKCITFIIFETEFIIPSAELTVSKYQHYTFKQRGISHINIVDIYDNSNRSDVIFIIEMYAE